VKITCFTASCGSDSDVILQPGGLDVTIQELAYTPLGINCVISAGKKIAR